jgi:hypothetical protein
VDRILGIDSGFKNELGAQFSLVFQRAVMMKHQMGVDVDGILGGTHEASLAVQFGFQGWPLIAEKMQ